MSALYAATPAPDWTNAACRGLDSDLFYPNRGESTREAKALCKVCPCRVKCLEYALDNNEKYGIWGAASERQRRTMRRVRRAA